MPLETEQATVSVRFRPATLDDVDTAADIWAEMDPDEPMDPEILRHWWKEEDPYFRDERWMALEGSRVVAAIGVRWTIWEKDPDRNIHLVIAIPGAQLVEYGDRVYGHAEERARAVGGKTMWAYTRELNEPQTSFITGRGYEEVSRQRWWENDLVANAGLLRSMAETSRARMREQNIAILTLADDDDPERYQKLKALNDEAQADEPSDLPHVSGSDALFESWLRVPGSSEKRIWIARHGHDIVGVSRLRFPTRRGVVRTSWTGTARSIRGQGVARALKLETLLQAIELGVKRVRTGNDYRNAPILRLNEKMGYRQIPGLIRFRKASA